jgi:hypothetical protein
LLFGALAVVGTSLVVREVVSRWMPEMLLDARGLRNFFWSVEHGHGAMALAATGFVAMLGLPWIVMPWLGARGLDRQRRWGWMLAVAACCLFVLSPLLPVAVFALIVLLSPRVRRVFFATA